jgi:DNA mismatch repair protein MutS
VGNAHFEAREWGEEVIFLRRLVPGGVSRSYGIQVARLAGIPGAVVARAGEILQNLEGGEFDAHGRPRLAGSEQAGLPAPETADAQLGLFTSNAPPSPGEAEALSALRGVDPERVTPLEALELLARLVARLKGTP